ncbi:hypothetical protein FB471_0480 [Amycolatopsis cihanbeyliensis]|uniref:Uncharacterized protein n=1 Tax=Amycolatopsis cihanbeyliensis TaxID=1128664 RepID=A0A542DCN5_AMYCI|nr:hypothetical protein FB471_0480 [Amycolatopsis cihanbeyliensis]
MLVVVVAVGRMAMPVVDVVHMLAVRHRDVAAALAVGVLVGAVHRVLGRFALVVVTVVDAMQVSVVDVIDMVAVRHGDMPATLAMPMVVCGVFPVCRNHNRH